MTSCVKNITFILTDADSFYVIENGKENNINKYSLHLDQKDRNKNQAKEVESQIWCHKLGGHAIIKYKNDTFYYNSNLGKEKVHELNLFYEDKYLQPYSVAFDDDLYEQNDTGEILFSDYNSDIYKLQITTNDQTIMRIFGRIFSFEPPKKIGNEEDDDFETFNYFRMDKKDRILDMKLISSSKLSMHNAFKGNEGKNISIFAITNTILFQFQGKDSFEKVFQNYSLNNGDILKAYKKFWGNPRIDNFRLSRIQLINQYLNSSKDEEKKEKRGILFGFMSKCGYCLGKLKNMLDSEPQKSFTVFNYLNPMQKEAGKVGKDTPNIKIVCQQKTA